MVTNFGSMYMISPSDAQAQWTSQVTTKTNHDTQQCDWPTITSDQQKH